MRSSTPIDVGYSRTRVSRPLMMQQIEEEGDSEYSKELVAEESATFRVIRTTFSWRWSSLLRRLGWRYQSYVMCCRWEGRSSIAVCIASSFCRSSRTKRCERNSLSRRMTCWLIYSSRRIKSIILWIRYSYSWTTRCSSQHGRRRRHV